MPPQKVYIISLRGRPGLGAQGYGFGRERPKLKQGSRGCGKSAVGAATCLEHTSKATEPEQLFPEKVSSVARWGTDGSGGASGLKSHAPPRWVLRPSPVRRGQGLAASPKDAERWPGCNIESTSQALLQSPEASGSFRDHQARWKFLKYILCAL